MIAEVHPSLRGKTAVITGGAGVLCREFAKALAMCGVRVAILNRTFSKAEAVRDEIHAAGGTAVAVQADVTDKASLEAAYRRVIDTFGSCQILINGAGGNRPSATTDDEFFSPETMKAPGKKSFFDLEEAPFYEVFSLNLKGALLSTQCFARDMVNGNGGTIINISSMNAFTPLTKIPVYSAAKAAVSNFTQWLAVHFAKSGIRVNAIAPGFFSTEQNAALLWNPDGTPTTRTDKILHATPMGRLGTPRELLGTLLWLVDEDTSGFVTGIVVPVDGGFSAYSGV